MSSPVCYERQLESSGVTIVNHSDVCRPCQASNNANANFQCCYAGDSCLEGGICNYTHSRSGGTGYYIADCTDPSFKDPSCPTHCGDQFWPDIVYNFTSHLWGCCSSALGVNDPDCGDPTSDTWEAAPPAQLKVVASIPSAAASAPGWRPSVTLSASSTVSSAGTSTSEPSQSAAATSTPSAGLSAASKAGLGVGIGLGIPLIACAVALVVLLRRRRRGRDPQPVNPEGAPSNEKDHSRAAEMQDKPHYPRDGAGQGKSASTARPAAGGIAPDIGAATCRASGVVEHAIC